MSDKVNMQRIEIGVKSILERAKGDDDVIFNEFTKAIYRHKCYIEELKEREEFLNELVRLGQQMGDYDL